MSSKRLTIACIAADLIPGQLGGAEHHIVEVAKRLAKHHKIYLFVGPSTSVKTILPSSVTVIPTNYPKIPNFYGLSFIFFGYFQIRGHLRQKHIDLIWAKQSFPQAPLAALLKLKFKKPLFITAQNPLLHQEELIIKGNLLQPFHKLFASIIHPFIKYAYSQADLVAAVSTYSAKLAKQLGANKVVVIPNGVNLAKPLRTKRYKTFTIITTSSLIPRNGLDTLISAVALLPSSLNWHLLIAGDGPLKNNLISQITNLNLTNNIKLLGRVSNQKIPELLVQSHIFVRPSRKEGFGVAFIEAMAAGIPVIGTNVGGIPDFLIHKKTGLFAKVDNPQSFAEAITLLHRDSKLSKQISKNAQLLVRNNYTWDKIAQSVQHQLLSLCH